MADTPWIREWLKDHPAPPPQARPKGVELSYSRVRAYLECPWLYKLRYADLKRGPLNPRSALGLSVHRALEAYHREDASTRERLLELYDEQWVHAGFPTPQDQMEWHRKGERILSGYWERETARRSEIIGVEREFLFELGPHRVRGMIDRIERRPEGGVEIVDYKTYLEMASEAEAASDLQLRIYALGAKESLALDPAWLTLYYVAAGERVTAPYDPSGEGEIRELLTRVGDILAAGRAWKPEVSFCPRCDFRNSCVHSVAKDA